MCEKEYTNELIEACRRNDAEYIRNGACGNVNAADECENTPLHIAVWCNSKECLEILIRKGADINVKNKCMSTPLHFAAKYNRKECLEILLRNEVSIIEKDYRGNTPLHLAASSIFREGIELLLRNGAIPSVYEKNDAGLVPLDYYEDIKKIILEILDDLELEIKEPPEE